MNHSVLSAGLLLCTGVAAVAAPANKKKPNVIVILTDDQGSVDVNCYGAKDLTTPNMDKLAKTGIKFTQFYVAAPVCSPSRASMLTGMNPHAAGLPGNASSQEGSSGMPTDRVTIAEVMKQAGYATAHIGKWHVGYTPETMPLGQGFDYSFGHMGGCIDNYSHFFYWNGPNRHDLWENGKEVYREGEYFGDLMEQKAKDYIENHQDEPFFMYYAINMPHYPLQPKAKWREHYKDLDMPRRDYAAFVSTVDDHIGQLVNKLEELKMRDNTIIIFQSDHGHSTEVRTFGGGGSAGPFRGCKFSLFEGGIRVPAIISWPGHLPQNEERHQMAFNIDWLPTIAEYCGIKELPEGVEGHSLSRVIEKKKESPHQLFFWKSGPGWAVRKGDWKLIGYPQDPSNETKLDFDKDLLFLVNLKMDSTEMTNLATQYPEKVEELKSDYLNWEYASPEDIPTKRLQIKHKANGKKVTIESAPHAKYKANGAASLVDGETGIRFFSDGFWLGFEGNDLVATIDMGKTEVINEISVGSIQDAESWIFFPEYIEVAWSADGKQYSKPVRKMVEPLKSAGQKSIRRITLQQEDINARFLKVTVKSYGKVPEWHSGKGGKAWLFVDEIAIQ
ncbi:sulfatase family protein [Sunxiuqinia rutila]|uniref:sulfatase family protein n=1 Tax=Sunxiuqinia rutila TaxID=1397841 RepID=UPI003D35C173